jgi:hypothetical protein
MGELKTKMIYCEVMARRPRSPEEILTRKDLEELQRRLSMMSTTAVQDFYPVHPLGLPGESRALSQPQGDAGARSGVEANAEVALNCRVSGLVSAS